MSPRRSRSLNGRELSFQVEGRRVPFEIRLQDMEWRNGLRARCRGGLRQNRGEGGQPVEVGQLAVDPQDLSLLLDQA